MRKWQQFSYNCESASQYSEILKYFDLENSRADKMVGDGERRRSLSTSGNKPILRPSYAVKINDTCVVGKKA